MDKVKNYIRRFWYFVKSWPPSNLRGMVNFEIIYRMLSFFVFFPCMLGLERLLLMVNRNSNIAAYNMDRMLLNPLSWIVFLLLVTLVGIFALVEQFAVSDAVHASRTGVEMNGRQIFETGLALTVKYLHPKNALVLLYVMLILPFNAIFDVSSVTASFALPGFVMESISQYWYYAAIYYPLMALFLYLRLRWFFCFIIITVEEVPDFKEACRRSAEMTKGRYKLRLLGGLLLWMAIYQVIYYAGYWLILLVGALGLKWLEPAKSMSLVLRTEVTTSVSVAFSFLYSWFSTPFLITCFQQEYYRRMRALGKTIPGYTHEIDVLRIKKWILPVALSACAVVMFFSVPARYRQMKWMMNTRAGMPMIMAHRGFSAREQENTLEAMLAALDAGVDAVEFDVQMTRDGEIVLLHDDSLNRVAGVNKKIWEADWEEIKDLPLRSDYNSEFRDVHIPRLDDMLEVLKGRRIFCNIEIKRTGHDEGIERKVVEIIKAHDFLDQCDVTSQDYETLVLVKQADPEVLTAYTTVIGIGDIETLEAADILSINETFATYREINRIHASDKKVFVWTVNDEAVMHHLVSLNVDAILTNDPELGVEVLEEHGSTVTDVADRLEEILKGF